MFINALGNKAFYKFDLLHKKTKVILYVPRLVFSQSLLALDMMEDFLELIDRGELEMPSTEDPLPLPFKQWKRDRDYLRLDGSTSPDARKNLCKAFNSTSNER